MISFRYLQKYLKNTLAGKDKGPEGSAGSSFPTFLLAADLWSHATGR